MKLKSPLRFIREISSTGILHVSPLRQASEICKQSYNPPLYYLGNRLDKGLLALAPEASRPRTQRK
jgi:hypothetical protein